MKIFIGVLQSRSPATSRELLTICSLTDSLVVWLKNWSLVISEKNVMLTTHMYPPKSNIINLKNIKIKPTSTKKSNQRMAHTWTKIKPRTPPSPFLLRDSIAWRASSNVTGAPLKASYNSPMCLYGLDPPKWHRKDKYSRTVLEATSKK